VTALAVDGARAEAFVREADGVARPEGDYAIDSIETTEEPPPAAPIPSASAIVVDLPDVDPHPSGGKRRTRKHRTTPRPSTTAPVATAGPPPAATSAAPVGSVKDGFTKLR
jgi:hypothetical protein